MENGSDVGRSNGVPSFETQHYHIAIDADKQSRKDILSSPAIPQNGVNCWTDGSLTCFQNDYRTYVCLQLNWVLSTDKECPNHGTSQKYNLADAIEANTVSSQREQGQPNNNNDISRRRCLESNDVADYTGDSALRRPQEGLVDVNPEQSSGRDQETLTTSPAQQQQLGDGPEVPDRDDDDAEGEEEFGNPLDWLDLGFSFVNLLVLVMAILDRSGPFRMFLVSMALLLLAVFRRTRDFCRRKRVRWLHYRQQILDLQSREQPESVPSDQSGQNSRKLASNLHSLPCPSFQKQPSPLSQEPPSRSQPSQVSDPPPVGPSHPPLTTELHSGPHEPPLSPDDQRRPFELSSSPFPALHTSLSTAPLQWRPQQPLQYDPLGNAHRSPRSVTEAPPLSPGRRQLLVVLQPLEALVCDWCALPVRVCGILLAFISSLVPDL